MPTSNNLINISTNKQLESIRSICREIEANITKPKGKAAICLTENQANYVYKKVEQGHIINTKTMKCEIEQEKLTELDREDDNPYGKVILNKVYKEEDKTTQIENWSILSDNVRYIQHDKKSKTSHKLAINTLDCHQHKKLYCKLKEEKSQTLEVEQACRFLILFCLYSWI